MQMAFAVNWMQCTIKESTELAQNYCIVVAAAAAQYDTMP